MKSVLSGYVAVREDAAVYDATSSKFLLRIGGSEVHAALQRVFVGKIATLKPNFAAHMPFLDEADRLIDVPLLIHRRDHFLLMGDAKVKGMVTEALVRVGLEVDDLSTWSKWHVEGPFAWKYLKSVVGQKIVGLRPLAGCSFDVDGTAGFCTRVSQTGEYGFLVLAPPPVAARVLVQLEAAGCGATFDAAALAVLAHEVRSPVFHATLQPGDCPIALGVKYLFDVSLDNATIRRLRESARSPKARAVAFRMEAKVADGISLRGQPVMLDGRAGGHVLSDVFSPKLGCVVGLALLDEAVAWPGCAEFLVGGRPLSTQSSPLLVTKSHEVRMV